MLAIVERFASRNLAKACANHLLLDERHSQVPFMAISYLSSQDPGVTKAEKWVRDNLARDFTVQELAEAVALAPRTFARRVAAYRVNHPYRDGQLRLARISFVGPDVGRSRPDVGSSA